MKKISLYFRKLIPARQPREHSPSRDWRTMLASAAGLALLLCAFSAYVFWGIWGGDFLRQAGDGSSAPAPISKDALAKTADYYAARESKLLSISPDPAFLVDPSI